MIKVADFGLTEDMYGTNYFRRRKSVMESEEKVPIRWMAPESIENDIYNESTDVVSTCNTELSNKCLHTLITILRAVTCVDIDTLNAFALIYVSPQWSFGVTVCELFTCGRVPYSGIPVMSLLRALKAGQRLEKPENIACSNEMLVK